MLSNSPGAHYVPTRIHSSYTLAGSTIKIKQLVSHAQSMQLGALALTDYGSLSGALQFSDACVKVGIQPIIGLTLPILRDANANDVHHDQLYDDIILYAQNDIGYQNLMQLSSLYYFSAKNKARQRHITWQQLQDHNQGLLCNMITSYDLFEQGQSTDCLELVQRLQKVFPHRVYMGISRGKHLNYRKHDEQIIALSRQLNVPLVATQPCYFLEHSMSQSHDALLCIGQNTRIHDDKRRKSCPDHYLHTSSDIQSLFADLPQAITNSHQIAQRCCFHVKSRTPMLPSFKSDDPRYSEMDENEQLHNQAFDNLHELFQTTILSANDDHEIKKQQYIARLEYELSIIKQMGYAGYFLIVADFICWAKAQKIPVGPGRGSGAGSLVAWVMKITNVDPLKFGLLFERFLNPERVSMPDFDIDFCQDRRSEVIDYVCNRYGRKKVANIITFGSLQARAVVRDVGRVMGMAPGDCIEMCKLIPNNPAAPVTLQQAIDQEPQLQTLYQANGFERRILDMGLQLEGSQRNVSTHAAGIVIGADDLVEYTALYYDPKHESIATQFNMKDVEKIGLVKFDFLGLKTLSIIAQTIDMIAKNKNITIDIDTIPTDDKATYELLANKYTMGIFQMESPGMKDALAKMRPDNLDDIIALISLYRPGPLDNIPHYIARKHGQEEVSYRHPILKEVLDDTYGIAIYQEQVMEIARKFADYTLGGADLLRRAMGKKIQAEMDKQRDKFVSAATKKDIDPDVSNEVFDDIAKFAGYGFNKSHAAAYGMITYQTAYLKAHFPLEFIAASMNYDVDNNDKIFLFKQDIEALGHKVLPPDINCSDAWFKVEKIMDQEYIRFGLSAIKNVNVQATQQAICEPRDNNGQYLNINDFANRLDGKIINNRKHMESLIKAGAFDRINMIDDCAQLLKKGDFDSDKLQEFIAKHPDHLPQDMEKFIFQAVCHEMPANIIELLNEHNIIELPVTNRKSLFENVERILGMAKKHNSTQIDMLKSVELDTNIGFDCISGYDWPSQERLGYEMEVMKLYVSQDPLNIDNYLLNNDLLGIETVALKNIEDHMGKSIKLATLVTRVQEKSSKKDGKKYAFVHIRDTTGLCEAMVFGEKFFEYRECFVEGKRIIIDAVVSKRNDEELSVYINSAYDFEELVRQRINNIHLTMNNDDDEINKEALHQIQRLGHDERAHAHITIDLSYKQETLRIALAKPICFNQSLRSFIHYNEDLSLLKVG